MSMHPQAQAFLDYTAKHNVLPENPTLEDLRADAADYLKYAEPARATAFTNVAPAIIALAEHDVLRDDGANYAVALKKAGIPVTLKEYPGMIHGFFGHGFMVDDAYNLRRWLSEQIVKAVH